MKIHAKQHRESNGTQSVRSIEIENLTERLLDPPGRRKKRGGEGAAVTHEACWLEREPVVTPQAKYQEQTDQVQQVYTFVRYQAEQV